MLIARHRRVTVEGSRWQRYTRQTGFYMHLPKYWSCYGYDFDGHWKSLISPSTFTDPDDGSVWTIAPSEAEDSDWVKLLKDSAEKQKVAHAECRFPYLHRSHKGYMRWIGQHRSWTWWYQGNDFRPGQNFETRRHEKRHDDRVTYHRGDFFEWHAKSLKHTKWRWNYRLMKFKRGWAQRHGNAQTSDADKTRTR